MITVYDMMSGTLRKDIEADSAPEQSQNFMDEREINMPELQLQEIEFDDTATNSMPAHLLNIKATAFLKVMK